MTAQDNLTTIEATPVRNPEVPAAVPPVLEAEAVPALTQDHSTFNQLLANGNYRVKEERSLNHLPPRESMPHPEPGPTLGELLGLSTQPASASKRSEIKPSSPVTRTPVQSHSE